jgi:hypothetical protein
MWHARPQVAVAVLVQLEDSEAETTVLSEALDVAVVNSAKPSSGHAKRPHPDRTVTILDQRAYNLSIKLMVLSELAALPAHQSFTGANPKGPVARGEQTPNLVGGQLVRRRLPGDGPDAIEAKQAEFSTQPEITVGRLRDGVDNAFGKAVADPPRGVRVLADVKRWILRERERTPRQQHPREQGERCDNASSLPVCCPHDA